MDGSEIEKIELLILRQLSAYKDVLIKRLYSEVSSLRRTAEDSNATLQPKTRLPPCDQTSGTAVARSMLRQINRVQKPAEPETQCDEQACVAEQFYARIGARPLLRFPPKPTDVPHARTPSIASVQVQSRTSTPIEADTLRLRSPCLYPKGITSMQSVSHANSHSYSVSSKMHIDGRSLKTQSVCLPREQPTIRNLTLQTTRRPLTPRAAMIKAQADSVHLDHANESCRPSHHDGYITPTGFSTPREYVCSQQRLRSGTSPTHSIKSNAGRCDPSYTIRDTCSAITTHCRAGNPQQCDLGVPLNTCFNVMPQSTIKSKPAVNTLSSVNSSGSTCSSATPRRRRPWQSLI